MSRLSFFLEPAAHVPTRFDLISSWLGLISVPIDSIRLVAYESEWSRRRFSMLEIIQVSCAIQSLTHVIWPVVAAYRIAVELP